VLKDFSKVKAKLPQYALRRGPKWYFHQSFWSEVVESLVLAVGGVTAMEIAAGMPPRLLGYPVEIAQVLPSVSAVSQVVGLFGCLDMAASMGDRRATTIAMSEHSRFATDEIEIRGTERFDINVHDVGNADATAGNRVPGPIVGLITAAS
jgi:HK97 family phage major capsid protein